MQLEQFRAEVHRLKTLLSMDGGSVQKEVLRLHEENMRLSSMLAKSSGAQVVSRSRSASPPKKTTGARVFGGVSYRKARTPTPTQETRNTIAARWTSSKGSKLDKRMVSPIKSSSRVLAPTASKRAGNPRMGLSRMRASLSPDRHGSEGRTKMREGKMSGPLEGPAFAYKKVLSFRLTPKDDRKGGKNTSSQDSPKG